MSRRISPLRKQTPMHFPLHLPPSQPPGLKPSLFLSLLLPLFKMATWSFQVLQTPRKCGRPRRGEGDKVAGTEPSTEGSAHSLT